MMSLGLRSAATISTMSRPVSCDSESSRASAAGVPAKPGIVMPSASATTAIVEAVPIVLQWPLPRIIDCSDARNCAPEILPGPRLFAEPPHVGAAAERLAAEVAGQHRTARHDDRGDVDGCRRHQQRGNRLVAAAEQHEPVDRVGAEHLLHRHRRHVAPQHRGRLDLRLAERDDGQVVGHAARCPHALLDAVGDLVEVHVARREVGRGVRDRDLRLRAVERVLGIPRRIHARWM